jgi:HAD superfamily hydrolase (TIGR01490 family)
MFYEKEITYREMALKLPEIYAMSLKGYYESDVNNEATVFVQKIKENNLYSYTKELVSIMKDYGLTAGISGSPIEVVRKLGKYFEFGLSFGTEVETKNGIYTGRLNQNLIAREGKEAAIKRIIQQKNIDLSKSFGFGDTTQDMAFLSKVGNPIAINPNQELLNIAKKSGWTICQSEETVINTIKTKLQNLI